MDKLSKVETYSIVLGSLLLALLLFAGQSCLLSCFLSFSIEDNARSTTHTHLGNNSRTLPPKPAFANWIDNPARGALGRGQDGHFLFTRIQPCTAYPYVFTTKHGALPVSFTLSSKTVTGH